MGTAGFVPQKYVYSFFLAFAILLAVMRLKVFDGVQSGAHQLTNISRTVINSSSTHQEACSRCRHY